VKIPLVLVCITVSGSGKSTAINELLYPAFAKLSQSSFPQHLDAIKGLMPLKQS